MGVPHSDPELGRGAAPEHWHIDPRFVSDHRFRQVISRYHCPADMYRWGENQSVFAMKRVHADFKTRTVRPMICYREMPTFPFEVDESGEFWHIAETIDRLGTFEDEYDRPLKLDCKVCPHKGIHLGSIAAAGGVITCPGHQLDFDAKTGKRIRRTVRRDDGTYRAATAAERLACIS
jgi:hypothetical protein